MAENSVARPRTRVNWTAAERAEWLALFEKSGQTAAEFCRGNDLSPATLSAWLKQSSAEPPELVDIVLPLTTSQPGAAVTVHLQSGVRLEIAAGMDTIWLAQLLRELKDRA
jgi:transposase-like protein